LNKLTKSIASVATTGLLVAMFAANAFASTGDNVITANGDGSNNTIVVTNTCTNKVSQTNNTSLVADVNASSSTGGNKISGNTGDGGIDLTTGDATTTVGIAVTGGDNSSLTPSCCCAQGVGVADPTIGGNGANTTNTIVVTSTVKNKTKQSNNTSAVLGVTAKSKTGKNKVKNNTGSGSTSLGTGDASTTVGIGVTGGNNSI